MPLIIPPTSHLRARLTHALDTAIAERDFVLVTRHGKTVAAIVSMEQVKRIWADEDIDLFGPINPPETGRPPMGAAWVQKTGGWKRGMPAPWEEAAEADGGDVSGVEETVERKRGGWWGGWLAFPWQ